MRIKVWSRRQESNLYLALRRHSFCPLNYGETDSDCKTLTTRQFCAWLGLVPGQYSSGGKQRLGRITKAGDPYLRTLLIMGGKAVLSAAKRNCSTLQRQRQTVSASDEK